MQNFKLYWHRLLSGLLVALLMLGLVPATAFAAPAPDGMPDTITLAGVQGNSKTYTSPNGLGKGGQAYLHFFTMDVGGSMETGFCYDGKKTLGKGYIGKSWTYDTKADAGAYAYSPFLDWYIDLERRSKKIDIAHPGKTVDEKKLIDPYYIGEFERSFSNGWVQASVWLVLEKGITDYNDEAFLQMLATERDAALLSFGVPPTSGENSSLNLIKQFLKAWKEGSIPKLDYYLYYPVGSLVNTLQPIIVPGPEGKVDEFNGFIKLSKTSGMAALPGATFGVYRDSSATTLIDQFNTSNSQWSYSPKLQLDTNAPQTFYVKEISAPPGYALDPQVYSVVVDPARHNAKDKAAEVNGGRAIVNTKKPGTPATGVVRKVDQDGNGIGPATFTFTSLTAGISKDLQTNDSGSLDLTWGSGDTGNANYLPPAEYTVTEKLAPAGYEKTDEVRNLKLWLETDADGNEVPMNSGPIQFTNNKQHNVILQKVDPDGNGLAGAYFDVYYNDKLLTNIGPTEADGSLYFAGLDGNGLKSGFYEFFETIAPPGYLIPEVANQKIHIDAEDSSIRTHVLSFENSKWPEIFIQKLSKGTNEGLDGAIFEVIIDGQTLGTFPTNDGGIITLTKDDYGHILTSGRTSWTVLVKEISPPDGYMLDDPNWQQSEIKMGETLARWEPCTSVITAAQDEAAFFTKVQLSVGKKNW